MDAEKSMMACKTTNTVEASDEVRANETSNIEPVLNSLQICGTTDPAMEIHEDLTFTHLDHGHENKTKLLESDPNQSQEQSPDVFRKEIKVAFVEPREEKQIKDDERNTNHNKVTVVRYTEQSADNKMVTVEELEDETLSEDESLLGSDATVSVPPSGLAWDVDIFRTHRSSRNEGKQERKQDIWLHLNDGTTQ